MLRGIAAPFLLDLLISTQVEPMDILDARLAFNQKVLDLWLLPEHNGSSRMDKADK